MPGRNCAKCGVGYGTRTHLVYCREYEQQPYVECVVPRCMVKTTRPDAYGRCPKYLWDDAHFAYDAALMRQRRAS